MPCHRAILQAALTFTSENREAIERSDGGVVPPELLNGVLIGMINTGEIPQSEVNQIDEALDLIYTMRMDTQMVQAMLPRFLEYQRTRRTLNSSFSSSEFVPTDIYDQMERIRDQVSSLEGDESVVVDPMDCMAALPTDESPPIPMGIDTLDSRLGGGVKRKKVVMICAYTGYGKSALGLNIAWRNSEGRGIHYGNTGLSAVFVTAEMPREECLCRYYSMMLAYPFETIWKGDPTGNRTREQINREIQQTLQHRVQTDQMVARSSRNFKVWDYSTKTLTPDTLRQQLMQRRDAGQPVDLMVVDYIDKMVLAPKSGNETFRQDRRAELGKISSELEDLAIDFDCVIVVLTKANDEGSYKARLRMTGTRDARLKNDPVSLWIGLSASEQDRANNVFTLNIDKNRDGPTFSLSISGRLDVQRFTDYSEESEINLQFGASARRSQT